jgi:hypothetical protein
MRSLQLWSAASLALLAACATDLAPREVASPSLAIDQSELVYGTDHRREYYQVTDARYRAVADATAAMVSRSSLTAVTGGYRLNTSTMYGSAYGLCTSEPYRTQPSSADCTVFQVGTDLIATAGHCVDASTCASTAFAFGFRMDDATTVRSTFPTNDVYFCSQVLVSVETTSDDYAVVRVDRPIVGRNPLPIRRSGTIALGAAVAVAGHPAGIPLKIADGATVRSNSRTKYFSANLDTYGGNSGSPVFNTTDFTVEGILVRGNTDFVRSGSCYVSNVCSDAGCPGWEDVSRSTRIVAWVPELPAGCTADAQCDDGNPCNGFETCVARACVDAPPQSCDDSNACTTDACDPVNPSTWECANTPVNCDDGNACTVDSCSAAGGCTSTPVVCAGGATCVDGACVAECLPTRASCWTNDECCSGKCRGTSTTGPWRCR